MNTPFRLNMVCIAEHWLNLVIALVGERFTDGVGMSSPTANDNNDNTDKNDVIRKNCIKIVI